MTDVDKIPHRAFAVWWKDLDRWDVKFFAARLKSVYPVGTGVQKHLLEPQTPGQFEGRLTSNSQNASCWVETSQNRGDLPRATDTAKTIYPG